MYTIYEYTYLYTYIYIYIYSVSCIIYTCVNTFYIQFIGKIYV